MTTPAGTETVEYDVRIEAVLALQNLAQLTAATSSFNQKILETSTAVKSASQQWGVSFGEAKGILAGLDKELSGTAESSVVFGGAGQAAWNKVGEASTQAGEKVAQSTNKMAGGINIVRTAMHLLVVGAIFEVVNAFKSLFEGAIKGLKELEGATYNLIGAERVLSQQGLGIKPKDLEDIVSGLQKLDPMLSKIQASEVVSRTARNVAPQVGFNTKEIKQFTEAVAILAIQNKNLGFSFEEVESQMTNAFLTGKVSQGINKLGVKITEQIVKDEALRMGLVKDGEEYDKLTGKILAHVKAKAMLSVLVQATDPSRAHLADYFKTADANFAIFQARLSDVLTKFGTLLAPTLIKVFEILTHVLEELLKWMDENTGALTLWGSILEATVEVVGKGIGLILKWGTAFGYVTIAIGKAAEALQRLIEKTPFLKKLADAWGFKGIGDAPDTPTNPQGQASDEEAKANQEKRLKAEKEYGDKYQEIMKDDRDKRLDIERNYQQKLQDIALNYQQKLEDIARNTAQKTEDAYTDYNQKVEDINRDSARRTADARQEAHRRQVDNEKKYQQQLKDLQQKFLMDLEEALHNRDARQILKLIQQHAIDKQRLEDNRKAEREQAAQDLQVKLQDIENDRKLKLEAAQRDLDEKLKQIQIAAQRERQDAMIANQRALNDARIAHNRALAEQREYLQRKLRDLADAIAKEYGMTAQGLAAIDSLFSAYTSAAQIANTPSSSSPASVGAGTYTPPSSSQYTSSTPITSSTWAQSGMYGTTGLAEGGSFLATTPQSLKVAENRPELITATPLGRPGADINKLFMSASMKGAGNGGNGSMEIGLTLSPDLEARVVKKSLDSVGDVIVKINRSKL